jgi:hypothetical protein
MVSVMGEVTTPAPFWLTWVYQAGPPSGGPPTYERPATMKTLDMASGASTGAPRSST